MRKWTLLKNKQPEHEQFLVYRTDIDKIYIYNKSMLQYCKPSQTWWQNLPIKPDYETGKDK